MNKNLREGSAPTNTPDNADFFSDIGKTFRDIINIFCCQRSSTHKENLHAMPHSDKKKFKVEIKKVVDDFVISLDFKMAEKDQLLISHLFLKSLKESFQDNSANSPELRFNKFKKNLMNYAISTLIISTKMMLILQK